MFDIGQNDEINYVNEVINKENLYLDVGRKIKLEDKIINLQSKIDLLM